MSLPPDFHTALRSLGRSPGFSLTVLVLLGAGLGLALTIGTAAWSLLARPLPYPGGERLVEVSGVSAAHHAALGWAPGLLADLRAMPEVEAVGAYEHRKPLFDAAGAEFAQAALSPEVLRLLGARPSLGGLFTDDDGQADTVLLSEKTWRSRFGSDPAIVGRVVEFDGARLRVAGVLGRSFRFPSADVAVWTPLHFSTEQLAHKGWFALGGAPVLARLAEGTDVAEFSRRLDARLGALPELEPLRTFAQLRLQAVSLRERWIGERRDLLVLLSAAAAAVLILLVANLAALWVGRWQRRERELALRNALGAGRVRLARLLVIEILLLGGAAMLIGLILVEPGLRVLSSLGVVDAALPWPVEFDRFALKLALSVAGALAFVSVAAIYRLMRRTPSLPALAHAAAGLGAGARAQRLLVSSQLALAVGLLTAGGLLGHSVANLLNEDLGFRPGGVLVVAIDGDGDIDNARLDSMVDDISNLPGVAGVSYGSALPFSGNEIASVVRLRDAPDPGGFPARDRSVGVEYFKVLGLPILRGRGFTAENLTAAASGSPRAGVIVDEQFVRGHLGGGDPLKAELGSPDADGTVPQWQPIIGVVPTVRHAGLDEDPDLGTVYSLSGRPADGGGTLLIGSEPGAAALGPRLRELAGAHGFRIRQVTPLDAQVRASVDDRMRLLVLVAAFALCGTILAALGLFAVVAFAVQRRRSEFALRFALGASAQSIAGLALRSGLRLALPGLGLGLLLALAIGRVLAVKLHRVAAWDGSVLLAVLALGLVIAVTACLLPARRAARSDPMTVLRYE